MQIRVTGIVIEGAAILLLDQDIPGTDRSWSPPGGKVEDGEALGDALVREMREETGLDVEPGRLLYVCDHLPDNGAHVVHLTFEARRTGGVRGAVTPGADTRPIRGVEFVEIADLPSFGFSDRFAQLALDGSRERAAIWAARRTSGCDARPAPRIAVLVIASPLSALPSGAEADLRLTGMSRAAGQA